MDLLSIFRRRPSTANVAKERLRIIVAQERSTRGGPDYLPVLRSELLHVIRKYVNVDVEAIQVNFERDGGHEVLELSVARCRSRRNYLFALRGSALSPSPPPTASARSTVLSNASRCAATRLISAWNRPRRTSSKSMYAMSPCA
jgi:cell division topological specificity factor